MKSRLTKLISAFSVLILFLAYNVSNATVHEIMVASFSFTPSSLNVAVGDTIRWVWQDGDHTTTCNGTTGTSRPAGADPWDAPIDGANTTFEYVVTVAGDYDYKCIPHFPSMVGSFTATTTSVNQTSSIVPDRFNLNQNYPNPFNPTTNIKFDIAKSGFANVTIYNSVGKEVARLVNENLSPGSYEVNWNATGVSSGIYYYRLETLEYTSTRKMVLVK